MDERFAARIAELEALAPRDVWTALEGLRAAWEAWARHTLELEPAGDLLALIEARAARGIDRVSASEAAHRLSMAEKHQWRIGTGATGSGEGLASMVEVRRLQLARAWMLVAMGDAASMNEARGLIDEVDADANGLGKQLRREVDAVRARLGR